MYIRELALLSEIFLATPQFLLRSERYSFVSFARRYVNSTAPEFAEFAESSPHNLFDVSDSLRNATTLHAEALERVTHCDFTHTQLNKTDARSMCVTWSSYECMLCGQCFPLRRLVMRLRDQLT